MVAFCLRHMLAGHKHGHEDHGIGPVHAASPGNVMAKAVDPVCGMSVDPSSAAEQAEYQGKTYYFCAAACKHEFERNPEKYVASGATAKDSDDGHTGHGGHGRHSENGGHSSHGSHKGHGCCH